MSGAVIGERLYIWVADFGAFVSVRAGDDAWQELSAPPVAPRSSIGLSAAGQSVVAYQASHEQGWEADLVYDPATDAWRELPADPLGPSFDRQLIWTDVAPVLLATALVPDPGSAQPSLLGAATLDLEGMAWHRLLDSEVLCCGGPWQWTGDRLVNASIRAADGGQTNGWGRNYPYGGILDPATGRWQALPNPPEQQGPRLGISAGGGGWAVGLDGWTVHARTDTWLPLPETPVPSDGGVAEVWAGDRLFVWGGYRVLAGRTQLLNSGWAWTPP